MGLREEKPRPLRRFFRKLLEKLKRQQQKSREKNTTSHRCGQ
jgi:hypothetical protein